ncbi:hypothetical protein [Pseudomonas triticicola]|jgi:hypothetical protein|uniref:hypothetical protein n=1 Tax=Pseudomonas triticicola TaxID=2842345 RepID=UPI003EB6BA06
MSIINENRRLWWDIVTGVCIVVIVIASAVKLFSGDVRVVVDFPTLLSLLFALFSVGLSALFYFKSTESSSLFYDNTYKFTSEVSLALTRMDSGLGEKMKLLENRYGDLKDYMQSGNYTRPESEVTVDAIDKEKAELEKVIGEKDSIIANLIESSTLGEVEKNKIRDELEEKNAKTRDLVAELDALKSKMERERFVEASKKFNFCVDMDAVFDAPSRVVGYAREHVLPKLQMRLSTDELFSYRDFSREFNKISKYLNESFLKDLELLEYARENRLTKKGHEFFLALSL